MISIIIPVFNLENYIARTIESVLDQTFQDIEIIIVDDGSTDRTAMIIDDYAVRYPDKIKVMHIQNSGVTSARLYGVRESSGEWIGFVDGDDEIEPEMYALLLRNADKYHADISHCGYQMHFEDGRVHYFYNTGCLIEQSNMKGLQDLLKGTLVEPGLWNKLFRRSLFLELLNDNIMDTSIKINEDLLMNYYLFTASRKSVYNDVCLYHYIVRASSVSRQKMNMHKIFDPIRVKQIILDHCEDDLKGIAESAFLNTCIYTYCALTKEKNRTIKNEKHTVRENMLPHAAYIRNLSRRTKILAFGIAYMPWLIDFTYPIYADLLQKKKYT